MKTQACPGINKKIAIEDLKKIVERLLCLLKGGPAVDVNEVVNNITQDENGALTFNAIAEPIGDILLTVLCPVVKLIFPTPLA
ncbi:ranaspumin-like [Rhinoderma darwinii]|uniref:ranaspumin-like n=1 Tax=Rhinoderma darwinii TaxID=43563 RepID=UPI003F67E72B